MAKGDGPVNSVTEILESLGRRDPSDAMRRIKEQGRSISGHAGHIRRTVNSLEERFSSNPSEDNSSALANANSQLAQVLAHRNSLKGAAQFVQGGGLRQGEIPSSVIEGLTKTAQAATAALQQFHTATQSTTTQVAQLGRAANGNGPAGPQGPNLNGNAGALNQVGNGGGNNGNNGNNGGNGGNGNRYSGVQQVMGGLQNATQTMTNFAAMFPIEQKRYQAEYAQRANDMFSIATGSDAMSMMLRETGAFKKATGFANKTGNWAVAGAIADGVLEAGTSIAGVAGASAAGNMGSAVGGGINGVSKVANQFGRLGFGLVRSEAEIQAYDAEMNLNRSQLQVPAAMRQMSLDYQTTLAENTYGMGGRGRESFITATNTPAFLQEMRKGKFDPEDFAKLSGAINLSSGMTNEALVGASSFAINSSRMGRGTFGETAGRMGALAASGASSPTGALAEAVGQAVANGFDNSKAVGLLVDATTTVAEKSGMSSVGVDGSSAITMMLGSLMQATGTKNQFQATAMANRTVANTDNTITDTSVNMNNMLRFAKLNTILGSPAAAIQAMKLTTADYATLKAGGPAAAKLASARGLRNELNSGTSEEGLNKIIGMESTAVDYQMAGGSSLLGRIHSSSLGVTKEQTDEVQGLRQAGMSFDAIVAKFPNLKNAVVAMERTTGGLGTSLGTNGKLKKNYSSSASAGANADAADAIKGNAAAIKANSIETTQNDQTPRTSAEKLDFNSYQLTPQMLGQMAEAAAASSAAMSFNTKQLETLNKNLETLNGKLGGGRIPSGRAREDIGSAMVK